MLRKHKATGIASAIVFFCCLTPLLADAIPGSTAVVDPFYFHFDEAGNAWAGTTNDNGATITGGTPSQGFYTTDPYSGTGSFLTYHMPVPVNGGDLAILPPNSYLLTAPGTTNLGSGIYEIPATDSNDNPINFIGGLRFYPIVAGTQSYMQFYFNDSFGEFFAFGAPLYAIVESTGTPASFSYIPGPAELNDNNVFNGVFAVAEPCGNVALLGLVGTGLIGIVRQLRRRAAHPGLGA